MYYIVRDQRTNRIDTARINRARENRVVRKPNAAAGQIYHPHTTETGRSYSVRAVFEPTKKQKKKIDAICVRTPRPIANAHGDAVFTGGGGVIWGKIIPLPHNTLRFLAYSE